MFLQTLFLGILIAGNGNAQNKSLKEINLSANWENVKLKQVFADLNKKTGFKFSFNNAEINLNKNITANIVEQSMDEVLRNLSEKANVKFKRVNSNIHVGKRQNNQEAVVEFTSVADVDI